MKKDILRKKLSSASEGVKNTFTSGFFYFVSCFVLLIFVSHNYSDEVKERKTLVKQEATSAGIKIAPKQAEKTDQDEVVDFALSQFGAKYTYAGKKPSTGFDCSGFTSYVYKASGIKIPPSSISQSKFGEPVKLKDAEKGDLIFFKSPSWNNDKIGHVGIIVSNSNDKIFFIHSSTSRGVVIDNLENRHYKNRYRTVRRVL